MNPWHDVPLGEDPVRVFNCIIEIPRGSKNKYELDKKTGLLRLDRVLYSSVRHFTSYGPPTTDSCRKRTAMMAIL